MAEKSMKDKQEPKAAGESKPVEAEEVSPEKEEKKVTEQEKESAEAKPIAVEAKAPAPDSKVDERKEVKETKPSAQVPKEPTKEAKKTKKTKSKAKKSKSASKAKKSKKAKKKKPKEKEPKPAMVGEMPKQAKKMKRNAYEAELAKLEVELVKLQGWIKATGPKVAVIFEGRDSAGKGGTIKRITRRLSPRVVRVAALPVPTEKEKTQWYFQRYIPQLPSGGEMVLFDRSWYNRAGVERVMGFCTDEEYTEFMSTVNNFEAALTRSGLTLIKYWLHISDENQEKRFEQRIHDPRRRWKLSPWDLEARSRWVDYSKARDAMLQHTSTAHAPWYIVDANIKRHARLNVIAHLLSLIPYKDLTPKSLKLPPRQKAGDYKPPDLDQFNFVPTVYPK